MFEFLFTNVNIIVTSTLSHVRELFASAAFCDPFGHWKRFECHLACKSAVAVADAFLLFLALLSS